MSQVKWDVHLGIDDITHWMADLGILHCAALGGCHFGGYMINAFIETKVSKYDPGPTVTSSKTSKPVCN